ncbi:MAG: phosphatase PAP2 family protein [Tumebacillaceae bacterium]
MKRVTGWVRHRDIATFFWVNHSWRNTFYDRFMPLVTHLGGAVWCIVLSLALMINSNPLWHQTGKQLAAGLLLSHVVVALCKKLMPRKRPYQTLENVSTGRVLMRDASFPSGHSTAAFCKATVLTFAFPDMFPILFGLATFVALSRVYLGQHYPSDIVIGACVGICTACLLV